MAAEPATFLGALVAISGSVTAVVKLLSNRSGLSRYTRRRDEEEAAVRASHDERLRALAKASGGDALEKEFIACEQRLEARIAEIRARRHRRRDRGKTGP